MRTSNLFSRYQINVVELFSTGLICIFENGTTNTSELPIIGTTYVRFRVRANLKVFMSGNSESW